MANDRLRSAITSAGLTVQELSEQIQVDRKTIERWITSDRVPHASNRQRLAATLTSDEKYLWPNALSDSQVRRGSEAELIEIYPARTMVPVSTWEALFDGTRVSLDILAFAASFLHDVLPNFPEAVARRAEAGVRVRLLFGDPESQAVAVRGEEEGIGASLAERCRLSWKYSRDLLALPNVEGRAHGNTLYASMFRFDDDLLINHHLFGAAASHSAIHHVHRLGTGRLFDNSIASLERVWHDARPVSADDLS